LPDSITDSSSGSSGCNRAETCRFLIENERRVIVHCKKLLDDQNLPTEDHCRLTRLLGEAEAKLQAIAS
jgi:hypothetical protein